MKIDLYALAERFVGTKEVAGHTSNPLVLAMLRLDNDWPLDDEVPWCSAFLNFLCWLLRLPRSKSLLARSWLDVGRAISLSQATKAFDIVVFARGGTTLDPNDRKSAGHVGIFAGWTGNQVTVLGGNQGDQVCIRSFPTSQVISVRRLYESPT